jgi:hypothetical protein
MKSATAPHLEILFDDHSLPKILQPPGWSLMDATSNAGRAGVCAAPLNAVARSAPMAARPETDGMPNFGTMQAEQKGAED